MGDYEMVKGMDDDYYRHLVHSYLACVSFVDDQLGRVLSALEKSDYADNTIIVLWSDHGQSFGEKRTYRKMSLWEESTHVPLYIVYPGNKSVQCDQAVSLLDIYPTLVDLCGLPKPDHLDGQSLMPLLENADAEWNHPVVSSWCYENYAVRSNGYRYIRYRDGSEEFYDHTMDEGEFNNLANDDQYKEQIEWHQSFIPESPTLPVGMKQWTGDELDATIQKWQSNNTMPDWLK
ncbi:MAG: sulfatase-like hydrolase/transferase, partial [Carboxylicivirga sp.]|nr:sulfatase-like hydrolase/transferase [Carboxylicivirga sp.]